MTKTEPAQLLDSRGIIVATVEVTAFPNNPGVIGWQGRYFAYGTIGYGTGAVLGYQEVSYYEVPGAALEAGDG